MPKMNVGVAIDDIWDFFHEVYAELGEHHQTSLFERRFYTLPILNARINQYLYDHDLSNFLRSNQVVFFEWATGILQAASRLPKVCGIVTRIHRYEMYRWVEQINWDMVDKIILVSNAKKKEFSARFPEQEAKIVIIPEAISLDRFQFRPKPFTGNIGTLCHLSPRKRVYELILAFYELTRKENGFHLHIGGEKRPAFRDYDDTLRRLVQELHLEDRVTFHGKITQPEEWYSQIDIFISNSYSEGLQVSPMEAIASGCYCLSHRWDGADELLPDEALFFTEQEMIQRILAYCSISEDEKKEKTNKLYQEVRDRFNVDKTKVQIRQVVEEVGGHWQPYR